jgi:hypothetical protein
MMPRVNIQCCVGYGVCFGSSGVVFWKSRDVKIFQDPGGVLNYWRYVYYWRKRESRCRRKEGICILDFLRFGLYPAFCWFINTKWPSIELAHPPGT